MTSACSQYSVRIHCTLDLLDFKAQLCDTLKLSLLAVLISRTRDTNLLNRTYGTTQVFVSEFPKPVDGTNSICLRHNSEFPKPEYKPSCKRLLHSASDAFLSVGWTGPITSALDYCFEQFASMESQFPHGVRAITTYKK